MVAIGGWRGRDSLRIEIEIPEVVFDAIAAKNPEPTDAIWTPERLCEHFQVTRQWLYERVSLGEILVVRVGKYLRFRKSAIAKWVESHSVPATSPLSRSLRVAK